MINKSVIALGADSNDKIVEEVKDILIRNKFKVILHGSVGNENKNWVDIANEIASDVANKVVNLGIIFCHTGTGVTIVANRYRGVRASLCNTEEIAICAKKWNDSNILTMGIMSVDRKNIENIILSWINTQVDTEELENIRRIDNIK